jgi:hypothetical protein
VKESADLVRIDPITGPGVCGAEYPLKVAALGESSQSFGFADDLRPPASIGGGSQPRWPGTQPRIAPAVSYPEPEVRPGYGAGQNGPVSLNPPGVEPEPDDIALPAEGAPQSGDRNFAPYASGSPQAGRTTHPPFEPQTPLPRLGPPDGNVTGAVGPVAIKPVATLACPIVSALDRWLADAVQPAAQRWFGVRVVEIKQISAYSCRGMNGDSRAHISEHAFGNALDVAAVVLADGRRISVKDGWKGMPEEQGFLRDVQGAACQLFNTVLAPGSNVYHYDHIHVDLMRRSSRRIICKPAAMSGEEVAARAGGRSYAGSGPGITGSLGPKKALPQRRTWSEDDDYEDE